MSVRTIVLCLCMVFTLGLASTGFAACDKGTDKACKSAISKPKYTYNDIEDAREEMKDALAGGDVAKAKEYAQEVIDEAAEFKQRAEKANAKIAKSEKEANDSKARRVAKRYQKRMVDYTETVAAAEAEAKKVLAQ